MKSGLTVLRYIVLVCLLGLAAPGLAWQTPSPLSLAVTVDPPLVESGGTVVFTFTLTNDGDTPLKQVRLEVDIPAHTVLEGANVGSEKWAVSTPPRGERGTVVYFAMQDLAANESAELGLWLIVEQETGKSFTLDSFTATAQGIDAPVAGEPVVIWVGTTPTPRIEPSPTYTPSPLPTQPPTATSTATMTPAPLTSTPRPTATPSPSPTITVWVAQLATPTPNLSTEQEQLGTLTVSIFAFLTLLLVVAAVAWLARKSAK